MLPPGRPRLWIKPEPIGSPLVDTTGIDVVAFLTALVTTLPGDKDDVYLRRDQFADECCEPLLVPIRVAVVDDDVAALHIAQFPQPLSEAPLRRILLASGA